VDDLVTGGGLDVALDARGQVGRLLRPDGVDDGRQNLRGRGDVDDVSTVLGASLRSDFGNCAWALSATASSPIEPRAAAPVTS
jgi:hypothetical protein